MGHSIHPRGDATVMTVRLLGYWYLFNEHSVQMITVTKLQDNNNVGNHRKYNA